MKEIKFCTFNVTEQMDMAGFRFPTDNDRNELFAVLGLTAESYTEKITSGDLGMFKSTWRALREAGWRLKGLEDQFLVWRFPETDVEKLEFCLKLHDWTYQMSDSHGVYMQGEAQLAEIKDLMRKVGEPLASELYKKYDYWNKE